MWWNSVNLCIIHNFAAIYVLLSSNVSRNNLLNFFFKCIVRFVPKNLFCQKKNFYRVCYWQTLWMKHLILFVKVSVKKFILGTKVLLFFEIFLLFIIDFRFSNQILLLIKYFFLRWNIYFLTTCLNFIFFGNINAMTLLKW